MVILKVLHKKSRSKKRLLKAIKNTFNIRTYLVDPAVVSGIVFIVNKELRFNN